MRDALSIMDQAIASAPMEDGQPRLDASQIRELMGTVPNAVFEKILEAVNANRSAEVITVANQLLDAGNSPAQLARQCVRYLRNCVIAKIAGIGIDGAEADGAAGELLQISADEQRRAGRSASLFSEEELTRFLQVMLRTFDELGYRQEQRFHFELGLLKLVHLRRLLPVEELLSQFPVAGAAGQTQRGAATTKAASPPPSPSATKSAPVASTKPAFSPFEMNRKRFDASATHAAPAATKAPLAAPAPPVVPAAPAEVKIPAAVESPRPEPLVKTDAHKVDAAPLKAADTEDQASVQPPAAPENSVDLQPDSLHSAAALQKLATEALTGAKSQTSAADALEDAEWTVAGGEIRVQTELSKTMLPMVVNPEAEKIVRAALRDAGAGALKLVLLPGAPVAAAAKKPRAAKTGSAQARALEHPIVQRAQTLFNAEIRNVIDLREND
jgi:DNA polymerase-3 subunit gamma/tau